MMRLLVSIGLVWVAVLLVVLPRSASGQTGGADPSTWPTPNPDPHWYYYDLGPFDDAAYRPVTIAEIVADPFQLDGQLVRVTGQYQYQSGARSMPNCVPGPATRPPTVEPGFMPADASASLADASGQLGVQVWGKNGDGFGVQDELAASPGDQIELRGIVRASYKSSPCSAERLFASAYLAIQRTDPAISFKTSAQDVGRSLTALPPGGLQDEVQPNAKPTP